MHPHGPACYASWLVIKIGFQNSILYNILTLPVQHTYSAHFSTGKWYTHTDESYTLPAPYSEKQKKNTA